MESQPELDLRLPNRDPDRDVWHPGSGQSLFAAITQDIAAAEAMETAKDRAAATLEWPGSARDASPARRATSRKPPPRGIDASLPNGDRED